MLDMLNGNMKLLTEFVMLFKLRNVFIVQCIYSLHTFLITLSKRFVFLSDNISFNIS